MSTWQALILGILQGITEFLPISSSGHLVILPKIMHWQEQSLSFDIILHAGTLLAILVYFYKDLVKLTQQAYKQIIKGDFINNSLLKIFVAAIPAGIVGLLWGNAIQTATHNIITISIMLISIGLVFIFISKMKTGNVKDIKSVSYPQALQIGIGQVLALVRGTSRSGITIITGLISGLDYNTSARFSFLVAIPLLLGSTAKGILDIIKNPEIINFSALTVGFSASFISGLLAVRFLFKILNQKNFFWFGIYRIILGIVLLLILL